MLLPLLTLALLTASPQATRAAQQGMALASENRLAEAVEKFEQAHRLDPKDPAIAFNLAQLYEATDRPGRAVVLYDTYLRLSPNAPDAAAVRERMDALQLGTATAQAAPAPAPAPAPQPPPQQQPVAAPATVAGVLAGGSKAAAAEEPPALAMPMLPYDALVYVGWFPRPEHEGRPYQANIFGVGGVAAAGVRVAENSALQALVALDVQTDGNTYVPVGLGYRWNVSDGHRRVSLAWANHPFKPGGQFRLEALENLGDGPVKWGVSGAITVFGDGSGSIAVCLGVGL